jgi:hypothetical protein
MICLFRIAIGSVRYGIEEWAMHKHSIDHDRHPCTRQRKTSRNRVRIVNVFLAIALGFASVALVSCASSQQAARTSSRTTSFSGEAPGGVRIGTYDSRAVTLAFLRSDAYAAYMKNVKNMHDEAELRGDTRRAAELNKYGESQQIRRHLQGFSTAPVEDILDTVRDQLPALAERMSISVITREADHHDASIELIDITDELVKLFDPDAKTLKLIADLREQKAVPIEVIARNPAGE